MRTVGKGSFRCTLAIVAFAVLFAIGPAKALKAQMTCTAPYDMSYIESQNYDGCGSNQWALQAADPPNVYFRGSTNVTGYCNPPYYNCNCQYVAETGHAGSLTFHSEFDYDQYEFWWDAMNYSTPVLTACSGSSCGGQQLNPVYTVVQYLGDGYTEPCD